MRFVMHSYTFRAYPFEHAVTCAQRFGWQGIELQPCHFNREQFDADVADRVEKAAALGVPIVCVDFGGAFISDTKADAEAAVIDMERQIETCGRLGVKLMNGCAGNLAGPNPMDFGANGSALATDTHYERAADAFRHLGGVAARHGVRIVFEIHMNTIHDTVASTVRLLDMIGLDNVQANPDPGNMFATSTAEKSPDCLDALDGRLGYFHFKNAFENGGIYNFSVSLERGQIDIYKWMEKLCALGYDGDICVEFCGDGDPHGPAQEDRAYLQRCLDWIR